MTIRVSKLNDNTQIVKFVWGTKRIWKAYREHN